MYINVCILHNNHVLHLYLYTCNVFYGVTHVTYNASVKVCNRGNSYNTDINTRQPANDTHVVRVYYRLLYTKNVFTESLFIMCVPYLLLCDLINIPYLHGMERYNIHICKWTE